MLIARYLKLEKLEESLKAQEQRPQVMEFSPGPSQVIPTQMKKMMELEIKRRVEEEMKRRDEKKPKTSDAQRSQSVTRRLFTEDEHEDEDAVKYKQRMEKLMQEDERRRKSDDAKKRDEEIQQQKKAWHLEQQKLKELEKQLQEEKQKNKELERQWTEAQWQWTPEEEVRKEAGT